MNKRSLYQCFQAKVLGDRIRCDKGHSLARTKGDGTIDIVQLMRGGPLELTVCQECPDFSSMGGPVAPEDRGWLAKPPVRKVKPQLIANDLKEE